MPITESDLYREVAEFCRYQDGLRWRRFQTAALIEAALAWVVWGTDDGLGNVTTIFLSIVGFVLILLLSIVSQVDESNYTSHLERLRNLEKCLPDYPFKRVHARFTPHWVKGWMLMPIAWCILLLFNIFMIVRSLKPEDF